MLRALAIRTMGCIRVDRITEYLCDPLEKALKVRHSCLCYPSEGVHVVRHARHSANAGFVPRAG